MPKNKSQEPYEGFTDDVKEIKAYLNYIYVLLTDGEKPESVRSFAKFIRNWKKEQGCKTNEMER